MTDIQILFDNACLTEEERAIDNYINVKWARHFYTETRVPLKNLFREPDNKGLKHIWKWGHADIAVFSHDGKLICIIEPGGSQHMQDEKQIKNDKRKYMLCKVNKVGCLHLMNGVMNGLSKRKWRKLLGSYLFGADLVR